MLIIFCFVLPLQFAGEYWRWGYQWFGSLIWIEHGENLGAWELWARHAILRRIGIGSWFGQKWHCHLSLIERRSHSTVKHKSRHIKFNFDDNVKQSLQYRLTNGSLNAIASSWLWEFTASYAHCYRNRPRRTAIVIKPNDFPRGARCQW